jgi:hypothetical protein
MHSAFVGGIVKEPGEVNHPSIRARWSKVSTAARDSPRDATT